MSNFAEDILAQIGYEPIEAITIGRGNFYSNREVLRHIPDDKINTPISWAEALQFLNYEYDDRFGAEDCYPVYIWTATRVLFVFEYDGSTTVHVLPRHPAVCAPDFNGGNAL